MKYILVTLTVIFITMNAQAQDRSNSDIVDMQKHQVVMQVTQGDSLFQLSVIGQIRNIKKALPNAEIEVVCHSQGLPMLVASQSKVEKHIQELSERGVTFAACENTMKRHKLSKEDMLTGVTTVPSGLVEIILKQEAGWSYIKGGI